MGSDESHFDVSLTVRDKVTKQHPQTATFEEKGEPKRIRNGVPLLTSLTIQYNTTLLLSVNTLIARGMFCGAKYTHHTFTPIIKH